MFVELMGILDKEHVVGVELVLRALDRPDGKGVGLAIFLKYRHHLPLAGRLRRLRTDDVRDLQLFNGQRFPRLTRKVHAMPG